MQHRIFLVMMMQRFLTLLSLCFFSLSYSVAAESSGLMQVDLIIFTHQQGQPEVSEERLLPLSSLQSSHTITLKGVQAELTPYHLLPTSLSDLRQEYWALNRKLEYQILSHLSWLQPASQTKTIAIPSINKDGWLVQGTFRIQPGPYYTVRTELLFSTPESSRPYAFTFNQAQRMKPNVVYYLDHPQAGLLMKIHKVS